MNESPNQANAKIVAIDSIDFSRGGRKVPRFTAAMGVAVTIAGIDEFKILYDEALDSALSANRAVRVKKVYSSTQLLTELTNRVGLNLAYQSLDDLFVHMRRLIERLDVFYTWYPPTRKEPVRIYGAGGSTSVELSPVRFLENKVIPPYPYFCAWKYHVDVARDVSFHLDNFQEAEVTSAWLSLANSARLFVFPHGDETHAELSTADIAAKVINRRLRNLAHTGARAGLYPEDLAQILPEFNEASRGFHFLGEKYLSFMYPLNPQVKIPIEERLKHPVIFLAREEGGLGRAAYERSPAWNALSDMAYDLDGTLKFFTRESDHQRMNPGDHFIYAGERGKRVGEELRSLGYEISLQSSEEIIRRRTSLSR